MKYKLIAADMDGTLLNDNLIITERAKSAIISAVEAGVMFIAATGRPMCALEKNINAFFTEDMPFIIFNGAAVMTCKSKKIMFSSPLQTDCVKQIYDLGLNRNVLAVVMWVGEELWVSRDCVAVREYQKLSGRELNIIHDIEGFGSSGVSKMMWLDEPENIRGYHKEIKGYFNFNGNIDCYPTRPELFEFVNSAASKGAALCEIGRIYGIDKSEMIAVGDNYNDLSMLEYAGLGVAMENSPDDIKAVCQYVTLSNNDDGVAAVIEKFVLM